MKSYTILLPDDLGRAVEQAAHWLDKTPGDFIADLLREAVTSENINRGLPPDTLLKDRKSN
jgi:predicted transcriptional regulator